MRWRRNIGELLKYERKSWGMSKRRLARLAHVDVETIEEIENGTIIEPDFYEMLNICEILESSIFYFLVDDTKI